MSAQDLADRIGVSKRTVYRDLMSMDSDAGLPIWQDAGKFGLERGAFLPPLALTLHEATTLFLAARLLAKVSDEHDTELIGAFVKLAQILPPVLAEHIEATVDVFSPDAAQPALHEGFPRPRRGLGEAARRRDRVRRRRLRPVQSRRARRGPAAGDRAVGADPRPVSDRLGRGTQGAAHVQGRADPVGVADAARRSSQPEGYSAANELAQAWDVIADEEPLRRRHPLLARGGQARRRDALAPQPGDWRKSPTDRCSGAATVAGMREIRIWIMGWGADAEVLEPATLRADVATSWPAPPPFTQAMKSTVYL